MANNPSPRRRKSSAAPFLELLDQMEKIVETDGHEWRDDIRADAVRRLNRLVRAVRFAVETNRRL